MRGDDPAARARAVEEVALALAIPHLLDRTVDTLSGGELQRVALAAALVTRPSLVLLDEPTSQLDPVAGDELIWLLRRLNEEWGVAVLLAEHRLERCLAAADRVVAMDAGADRLRRRPRRLPRLGPGRPTQPWRPPPPASSPSPASSRCPSASATRASLASTERAEGAGPPPRLNFSASRARPPTRHREVERGGGPAPLNRPRSRRARPLGRAGPGRRAARRPPRHRPDASSRGERVALMGRNGAGKSTLLRDRGRPGRPGPRQARGAGGIALLTQNPSDYLVRERVGDELPGEAGLAALRVVGLEHAVDADPRDLSGGERQRLALAIALAGQMEGEQLPGLVALDEPTRGMDRARKDDLVALIERLAARGAGVVVATHDVEFAAAFAERVVLLGDGVVIADGPPARSSPAAGTSPPRSPACSTCPASSPPSRAPPRCAARRGGG